MGEASLFYTFFAVNDGFSNVSNGENKGVILLKYKIA